jgi:hypothetical protein
MQFTGLLFYTDTVRLFELAPLFGRLTSALSGTSHKVGWLSEDPGSLDFSFDC